MCVFTYIKVKYVSFLIIVAVVVVPFAADAVSFLSVFICFNLSLGCV